LTEYVGLRAVRYWISKYIYICCWLRL